jgi:fatty-acyl-CoA synthase
VQAMQAARTMVVALEQAAASHDRGFTHVAMDGTSRFESFHELHRRAVRIGNALRQLGVARGDRVGLILSESGEFTGALFGIFMAGAVAVPLASPSARYGQSGAFLRHLAPPIVKASPRLLLADEALAPVLAAASTEFSLPPALGLDALLRDVPDDATCESSTVGPEDDALLQFTSGSTSQPKGVRLRHANLVASVSAMADPRSFRCTPDDYCVTWLPLHHDMGLIAQVLMPVYVGMRGVTFMAPGAFLADPLAWLRKLSETRGTFAFAPNFAFALCTARATAQAMEGLDLSCVRVTACAAEPIRFEVLDAFARKFEAAGLRRATLMPCYGLAEHTLGATISPAGTGMAVERVQPEPLLQGTAIPVTDPQAPATTIVGCGRFLVGHEGKIVDAGGASVPDGRVGELLLRGPSVMHDYFDDAVATAAALQDGWLRTGDMAYVRDGQLFVCGRSKDVLILQGRKFQPQDLEWEAEQVQGVRPGCVAALAIEDRALNRDRVVIVAETKLPTEQHGQMQNLIRRRIHEALTVLVDQVVMVPPQTLPKTSSGKLQRTRARLLLAEGKLAPAAAQV